MWKIGKSIGDKEGRMDVCIAAAGVLRPDTDCLEYPDKVFEDVCPTPLIPFTALTLLQVIDINVNGVLYTAQAAGRQMERFGNGGSIVLIASMSGSITNKVRLFADYKLSRWLNIFLGAFLGFLQYLEIGGPPDGAKHGLRACSSSDSCQHAQPWIHLHQVSPAVCRLATCIGIDVLYSSLTAAFLDKQPHLFKEWTSQNPMGRLGRPDELRGVVTWLASDASSFCTGSEYVPSFFARCLSANSTLSAFSSAAGIIHGRKRAHFCAHVSLLVGLYSMYHIVSIVCIIIRALLVSINTLRYGDRA